MPTPIIVTFYSFRGGVGRTMAMLNAGWVLARTGSRVLLVDFDLEAPGLTRLIARQDLFAQREGSALGVADIILQLLNTPDDWAFHANKPLPVDLAPFLRELKVPQPTLADLPQGRLAMIPAGKEGYEAHLARIHSEQFTVLHQAFAARFREVLLNSGEFDYVLVDARTGYSDEAYIAARYLCDHLVVLTGLNDQNIEGTGRFLSKVSAWSQCEERSRSLTLIASPVPEHEDELKAQRFEKANSRLAELSGSRPVFALRLPYYPRLSLYEEAVVDRTPPCALGIAYQDLADKLRVVAQDAYPDCVGQALAAIDRRDFAAALAYAKRAASIDALQGSALLYDVGTAAWRTGCYGTARAAYQGALALFGKPESRRGRGATLLNLAQLDIVQGAYRDAHQRLIEGLDIFRQLRAEREAGSALCGLGELEVCRGHLGDARSHFESALSLFHQVRDSGGEGDYWLGLGEMYYRGARYGDAAQAFELALPMLRQRVNDPRINMANLYLQASTARANLIEEALDWPLDELREAAELIRESGDPHMVGSSFLVCAQVLRDRGEPADACHELSEGIGLAEDHGLVGLVSEMRAERALAAADAAELAAADPADLAAADAGDLAEAAADAREAIAFFEAQDVAHPHLARLRELAANK